MKKSNAKKSKKQAPKPTVQPPPTLPPPQRVVRGMVGDECMVMDLEDEGYVRSGTILAVSDHGATIGLDDGKTVEQAWGKIDLITTPVGAPASRGGKENRATAAAAATLIMGRTPQVGDFVVDRQMVEGGNECRPEFFGVVTIIGSKSVGYRDLAGEPRAVAIEDAMIVPATSERDRQQKIA